MSINMDLDNDGMSPEREAWSGVVLYSIDLIMSDFRRVATALRPDSINNTDPRINLKGTSHRNRMRECKRRMDLIAKCFGIEE